MHVLSGITIAVLLSAAPAQLFSEPAPVIQPRLAFEPNVGQTAPGARFLSRARGGTFFFTTDGVVLGLQAPQGHASGTSLRMTFVDANRAARVEGGAALPGKVNHFVGNDPSRWHAGVPTYSGIRYADLYPGVALAYGGDGARLKGTYTVAPGADPSTIRWRYEGGQARLDDGGRLRIRGAGGADLTEDAPLAWQEVDGRRAPVAARYALAADGSVGFVIGDYDRTRPLTIDPVISYSTFLGGSIFDMAWSIAVDAAGNAYIGGYAASSNFPTVAPYQSAAGGQGDGFVAKFAPDGTPLYSTYFGGTYIDYVTGIAVDAQGNAYVTGFTGSVDLPTLNAFQPAYAGGWDSFVTKLSPDGSALLYSTYLGGSSEEDATRIAVDAAGAAYVIGNTQSADFPVVNAFQSSLHGTQDTYVTKVSPAGTSLAYSTFLGGERGETAYAIAVTAGGSAVVTGDTTSFTFPTRHAYQSECAPSVALCWDAFVTRLSSDGGSLIYSTYLGGNDLEYVDRGFGVTLDGSGVAYVTGATGSPNFPTLNAYQPFYAGQIDVFVARIGNRGQLLSSTFLGGENSDIGYGIAVDGPGAPSPGVHVSGLTLSTNFPVVNPIQGSPGGFEDPFVAKFTPDVQQLAYSSYLGGSNGREEWGSTGVAVDAAGNVYLSGGSEASDFPTVNAYQPAPNGSYDAFLVRIDATVDRPKR